MPPHEVSDRRLDMLEQSRPVGVITPDPVLLAGAVVQVQLGLNAGGLESLDQPNRLVRRDEPVVAAVYSEHRRRRR